MGLSTLVVGDAETIKVHVHVPRPSVVLAYAETMGRLHDVVIEDMAAQYQQFLLGRSAPPIQVADLQSQARRYRDPGGRAWRRADARLSKSGHNRHRAGRPNDESQHAGFLQLLEAIPTDRAMLLPNNSNVDHGRTAGRRNLARSKSSSCPSKTIPQGIAAMLAFNDQRDLEANAHAMEAATQHVKTGEITTRHRAD